MFFVKSISILFLEISRTSQWKFSLYQHSSGGGGGGGRGGRIWKGTVGGIAVNTTVPWQFTHEILSGCTQKLLCEVHIPHFAYFLF